MATLIAVFAANQRVFAEEIARGIFHHFVELLVSLLIRLVFLFLHAALLVHAGISLMIGFIALEILVALKELPSW